MKTKKLSLLPLSLVLLGSFHDTRCPMIEGGRTNDPGDLLTVRPHKVEKEPKGIQPSPRRPFTTQVDISSVNPKNFDPLDKSYPPETHAAYILEIANNDDHFALLTPEDLAALKKQFEDNKNLTTRLPQTAVYRTEIENFIDAYDTFLAIFKRQLLNKGIAEKDVTLLVNNFRSSLSGKIQLIRTQGIRSIRTDNSDSSTDIIELLKKSKLDMDAVLKNPEQALRRIKEAKESYAAQIRAEAKKPVVPQKPQLIKITLKSAEKTLKTFKDKLNKLTLSDSEIELVNKKIIEPLNNMATKINNDQKEAIETALNRLNVFLELRKQQKRFTDLCNTYKEEIKKLSKGITSVEGLEPSADFTSKINSQQKAISNFIQNASLDSQDNQALEELEGSSIELISKAYQIFLKNNRPPARSPRF